MSCKKEAVNGPDCRTCWQRETCERMKAGSFCAAWATRKPREPELPDAWALGEAYPETAYGKEGGKQ